MIYSEWNQGRRQYDYFETPVGQFTANTPAPKHLRQRKLGTTVEQAGWPIPKNARHVGAGDYPRGRIGTRTPVGGVFSLERDVSWWTIAAIGVGAILLFRNRK